MPLLSTVGAAGARSFGFLGAGHSSSVSIDYLVVAGGGGGGKSDSGFTSDASGGGGAGGMLTGTVALVKGLTYAITVGDGGLGGLKNTSQATNGGDSSIGTLVVSTGGGRGGGVGPGANGGSGGGAGSYGAGGAGIAGQGYSGATVSGGNFGAGGGAGGAASGATPGPGLASSITGTVVTYATGGAFGGSPPPARSPNSGDGGYGGFNSIGAAGGSGVVVIRYASSLPAPFAITGIYSDLSASTPGYRTYQFTGNGAITL